MVHNGPKKSKGQGQSPPQEPEVGPNSELYLLVLPLLEGRSAAPVYIPLRGPPWFKKRCGIESFGQMSDS